MSIVLASLLCVTAAGADVVDASTIHGKVMCGYQGWFRCPGDRANMGWIHWSGDPNRIASETLTFEMWPDMAEYGKAEQYPAPGFTHPDGAQAMLYSAENPETVLRHFTWMRQYGIHGAWLQHFVVDLPGGPVENRYPSQLRVMENCRMAAEKTGRVWAIAFDMAKMPAEKIFDSMTAEWKRCVDTGVTDDKMYLREGGRPVLMVWGFYPKQNMTPELGNRIIDFFKNDGKYRAFLVGGCEWPWRTEPEPGWRDMFRRFDAMCPWNVGNYSIDEAKIKWASTHYWKDDIEEAKRAGILYIPVFYPGFSWDNLTKQAPGQSLIERNGGKFFWKQFCDATKLGCDMGYIAMFDEVDEGTAIYKVTSTPPTQAHFVGYEGLPSDWYLRLAGEGTRMLLHERAFSEKLPVR